MPTGEHILYLTGFIIIIAVVAGFVIAVRRAYRFYTHSRIFEDVVERSVIGYVYYDGKGRYWRHNKAAEKFLPVVCGHEQKLKTVRDLIDHLQDHAIDLEGLERKALHRSLFPEGTYEGFTEVVGWGTDKQCLVRVEQTAANGTVAKIIDISDYCKQQELLSILSQSHHELGVAINATEIGIIISDPKMHGNPVTFVNRHFSELTGLHRNEIEGNDWRFILDLLQNDAAYAALDNGFKNKKKTEIEISYKNSVNTKWFALQVSPVSKADGKADLFVGILTDITTNKIQEAHSFQAQRLEALGQLAGGVAHDFNNILSIVDGYSRMSITAAESGEFEKISYNLERVRAAVDRGAGLTRQLLAFGRQKVTTSGPMDLGSFVLENMSLLKPLVTPSIELKADAPRKGLCVHCPSDVIGNMLINLVVNAKDAMPDGGTITIHVDPCDEDALPSALKAEKDDGARYVCISVADTGEGIPEEIIGKIFDPFFTTKPAGKGTGLGLSMVYGLVREMEGHIEAHSSPGEGTVIAIYLPLFAAAPVREITGDSSIPENMTFEGYTVLVVEDEPDLLDLVVDLMERCSFSVLRAANAEEALIAQEEHEGPLDLLLTDVVMPGINGIRLSELVRSVRPETQVILMSGYPSHGEMARYKMPSDALLISKPVNENALMSLVYKVLSENALTPGDPENPPEQGKEKGEVL